MGRRNQVEGDVAIEADAEFVTIEELDDTVRRLRVYDNNGDFIITIPDNARVTFGYFNPASAGSSPYRTGGYDDTRGEQRRTALRVYGPGGKENQLAVFCGVKGFRDETQVKLVRLREEVTLTTEYHNDGEGGTRLLEEGSRTVKAVRESEIPF